MYEHQKGLIAAMLAPFFLGMAPIFGKVALMGGADPFTVASFRSALVALMMWTVYLLFWRRFIYIYPAGLLACVAIGFTNGIGSLFYYSGLDLLDASVAQLLNSTYLVFVVLLTRIDGANISPLTIVRMSVALLGVLLITGGLTGTATWLGVGLMLGNALLFAGTVVMSQRILYEMPAQTVTLYIMTAMAGVVVVARVAQAPSMPHIGGNALVAIVALSISTAFSRLLLFAGVKGLGSLRTALLAIAEGAVAVSLAFIFFEESLDTIQWIGVGALVISLFIPTEPIRQAPQVGKRSSLPNVAGLRFQRMVSADKLSTQEIQQIVHEIGPLDKLDTQEINSLNLMLGEDIVRKLRDFEGLE